MPFGCRIPAVYLSGVYTRSTIARVRPRVGDTLYDNHRHAIMAFVEDTTIGIHDMLYAPCDPQRYLIDYEVTEHRSCKENVLEALATLDVHPPVTPEVFNIFQNSGPDDEGNLSVKEPVSRAGDYVVLLALDDLIVAGSACPQDLNPCNGYNPRPPRSTTRRRPRPMRGPSTPPPPWTPTPATHRRAHPLPRVRPGPGARLGLRSLPHRARGRIAAQEIPPDPRPPGSGDEELGEGVEGLAARLGVPCPPHLRPLRILQT